MPEIDLKAYSFRAVIDWVEFEIHLDIDTQFQWAKKVVDDVAGRSTHVKALHERPGGVARHFVIRLQAPRSTALAARVCEVLFSKFGGTNAVVTGIEVSLDVRPKVLDEHARLRMLGLVQRTIFPFNNVYIVRDQRPRCWDGKQHWLVNKRLQDQDFFAWLDPRNHQAPLTCATMYLGAKDDPEMVRIMDKVTDERNNVAGTARDLVDVEKRVRVEVALHGHPLLNLGVLEVKDLPDFQFTKLQGRYFSFKLPTFTADSNYAFPGGRAVARANGDRVKEIFAKSGTIGVKARELARPHWADAVTCNAAPSFRVLMKRLGGKAPRVATGWSGSFVAYEDMNRCVSTAFRHLQERERTAWKGI